MNNISKSHFAMYERIRYIESNRAFYGAGKRARFADVESHNIVDGIGFVFRAWGFGILEASGRCLEFFESFWVCVGVLISEKFDRRCGSFCFWGGLKLDAFGVGVFVKFSFYNVFWDVRIVLVFWFCLDSIDGVDGCLNWNGFMFVQFEVLLFYECWFFEIFIDVLRLFDWSKVILDVCLCYYFENQSIICIWKDWMFIIL